MLHVKTEEVTAEVVGPLPGRGEQADGLRAPTALAMATLPFFFPPFLLLSFLPAFSLEITNEKKHMSERRRGESVNI